MNQINQIHQEDIRPISSPDLFRQSSIIYTPLKSTLAQITELSSFSHAETKDIQKGRQQSIASYQPEKISVYSLKEERMDVKKQKKQKLLSNLIDVYDKEQIKQVIMQEQDIKERSQIIDKIIQRRDEIKNAKQIMQISRCVPLINRFVKKITTTQSNPNNSSSSKNSDYPSLSVIAEKQDIVLPSTLSIISSQNERTNQVDANQQKRLTLSLFYKYNDNVFENNSLQRQAQRKLTLVTKDNVFFKKKHVSQVDKVHNVQGKSSLINLNTIVYDSKALEMKGKIQARERVNALLKDQQKLNLACHFKSKSMNKYNFNNSSVNSFNLNNVILKTKVQSKISTLNTQQKKYIKTLSNYLSYEQPQHIIDIVQNDVAHFVQKLDTPIQSSVVLNILPSPSSSNYSELYKIDNGARIKLNQMIKTKFHFPDKSQNLSYQQTSTKSLHEQSSITPATVETRKTTATVAMKSAGHNLSKLTKKYPYEFDEGESGDCLEQESKKKQRKQKYYSLHNSNNEDEKKWGNSCFRQRKEKKYSRHQNDDLQRSNSFHSLSEIKINQFYTESLKLKNQISSIDHIQADNYTNYVGQMDFNSSLSNARHTRVLQQKSIHKRQYCCFLNNVREIQKAFAQIQKKHNKYNHFYS